MDGYDIPALAKTFSLVSVKDEFGVTSKASVVFLHPELLDKIAPHLPKDVLTEVSENAQVLCGSLTQDTRWYLLDHKTIREFISQDLSEMFYKRILEVMDLKLKELSDES